jgi:type IV pilus assembly protein PilO
MRDLVAKILKLKTSAKLGLVAGVMAAIVGIYYQLFYADLSDSIESARTEQQRLREELASYEKRKIEYLAYRNELLALQEEQRELLKILPHRAELGAFLSNIQEQIELAGLEIANYNVEAEAPEELYVRIPVRFDVRGGFHNITKFFKNVSELKRIVNVENLNLVPDRTPTADPTAPSRLRAKFVAVTFRLPEAAPGAAP